MVRGLEISVSAVLLIMAQFAPTSASAEAKCTDWLDQGDGTSWAECVYDNGNQHCYVINNAPGSTAREVSCSQ